MGGSDSMEKDPLDELIVDEEEELDKSIVSGILKDYCKISKQTGNPIPNDNFYSLKNKQKIIIFLLSRRAANIKNINIDFRVTSKEISEATGMKYGTVSKDLTRLCEESLVKSEENKFFIPNHAINPVQKMFNP